MTGGKRAGSACRRRRGTPRCRSCPGVPTLVLTGGWEPLYEEIAGYLRETGALHRTAPGGHRPQDSKEGDRAIRSFIADVNRSRHAHAS